MSFESKVNTNYVDPRNIVILDPKVNYYGGWDSTLNPAFYIEKTYSSLSGRITDERSFDADKIGKYLLSNGAAILEQKILVRKSLLTNINDMMPSFISDGDSSSTYLYKDTIVSIHSGESDNYYIAINWPIKISNGYDAVYKELLQFLIPEDKSAARVSILMKNRHGSMKVEPIAFKAPIIDDLELNYGKGFTKVYDKIVDKLNESRAGLICFHGPAGTGKTTFLKHLTTKINREFIFIPVGMAPHLADPDFLTLLMSHKESILVLEDAEQALTSREVDVGNSSVIATMLNICDGLIGSLLNITVIASYNADRQTIDKALLRRGRLAFDYTFDKLSTEDARRVAIHLKKDPNQINEPTSLADIYNAEDDTGYIPPVQKTMGFGFATSIGSPVTPKK